MIFSKVNSYKKNVLQENFTKLLATKVYENKKTKDEIKYNDVADLVADDNMFNFLKGCYIYFIVFIVFILV